MIFLVDDEESYGVDFFDTYFSGGSFQKIIQKGTVIEELVFPDQIKDEKSDTKFTKNKYDRAFFTDAKLKKAFIHPQLGQVWMTDGEKDTESTVFELNGYINWEGKKIYLDTFDSGAFFIKSPDGLAVSYKMIPKIAEESDDFYRFVVLNVTWNNGNKNSDRYETNPIGCGSNSYTYLKTKDVNIEKDLVIIGKTSDGKNIYGFKDINHVEFKKLYDEIYWVSEEESKLNEGDFLKTNPEVFWVDPYGRTLAFFKESIISPAECGKPVIYLYPEKTSKINVQVSPTGGMSISDPDYGKGWDVVADNQSNITNLKDGRKYPYLFWEGSSQLLYSTPEKGFVVTKDNLENLLNEKLAALGLRGKEISDFKEFWLPKMTVENKPYYFVTFLSKSTIDKMAPLSVSPRPDTVIRVLMDYQGLDEFRDVPGFEIKTPERKGFTVVEWGGMLK
jgi:hypothetical protein